MAINPYFKYGTNSEKNLYEDLITESIQNFGQNIYYIPREVVHRDMIFNDTILSEFNYAYTIEVYLESVEGFDGDGDLFSKFGVEIRDAVTFIMSRRRWDTEIRSYEEPKTGALVAGNKYYRPREGDLIHMPMAFHLSCIGRIHWLFTTHSSIIVEIGTGLHNRCMVCP